MGPLCVLGGPRQLDVEGDTLAGFGSPLGVCAPVWDARGVVAQRGRVVNLSRCIFEPLRRKLPWVLRQSYPDVSSFHMSKFRARLICTLLFPRRAQHRRVVAPCTVCRRVLASICESGLEQMSAAHHVSVASAQTNSLRNCPKGRMVRA